MKDVPDYFAFIKSRFFKMGFGTIIILALLLLALKTDLLMGRSQATASRWSNGFFPNFSRRNFLTSYSIFGLIVKIDGQALIIQHGAIEQNVIVSDRTTIRHGRATVTRSDLTPNMRVIIVGSPNGKGFFEAKFIRVLNSAPHFSFPINH